MTTNTNDRSVGTYRGWKVYIDRDGSYYAVWNRKDLVRALGRASLFDNVDKATSCWGV